MTNVLSIGRQDDRQHSTDEGPWNENFHECTHEPCSSFDVLGQVFEGKCRQTVAAGNRSRGMCFVEYASMSSKHAIVMTVFSSIR